MEIHTYTKPVYTMSVTADNLNIHPQTLRFYERQKLVVPGRNESGQRMYSKKDWDDIIEIRTLTREKGVNLAGVAIILELRAEIARLTAPMEEQEAEL